MSEYFLPPDGYRPPQHCETCEYRIILTSVIGGRMWVHLGSNSQTRSHGVKMRPEGWWDVSTGTIKQGNGFEYLRKDPPQEGMTPS